MSKFELRPLNGKDLFPMVNLIKKFGVDNFKKLLNAQEIKNLIDEQGEVNEEQLQSIVGISLIIDVLAIIVENIGKCEDEVFTFLSNISNMKKEEVEALPLDDLAEMIMGVLMKKELKGFFGVVFKFLK